MVYLIRPFLFSLTTSFILVSVRSNKCPITCDEIYKCDCHGLTVICEDVTTVPQCLPLDIETLLIKDSLGFRENGETSFRKYKELKRISLSNISSSIIHRDSFLGIHKLETFEIRTAPMLEKLSPGMFRDQQDTIKTIRVEYCTSLQKLEHGVFSSLPELEDLVLRSNGIQEVHEESLSKCYKVQRLDLSGNQQLQHLPRYVFQDLIGLRELFLDGCDLQELYPEHVKYPFEERKLETFEARYNDWQCEDMCEFIEWKNRNDYFTSIAAMGYCSSPESLQTTLVLDSPYSDPSSSSGRVVLILLIILVYAPSFAVMCCILLAIWHCLKGLCESTNNREENQERSIELTFQHHSSAQGHQNSVLTVDEEVNRTSPETMYPADIDSHCWDTNDIEPPAYDIVTENCTQIPPAQTKETDSMDETPPPAYDNHTA